jgi:YHS domain-containing protein
LNTPPSLERARVKKSSRPFSICALLVLAVCLVAETGYSQDDQDLLIRTYLFKADAEGAKRSQADLAAFLASPPLLSLHRGPGGAAQSAYEAPGKLIGSLYRIPNIVFLTSSDMRWEGSRENLNEAVIDQNDIYPIQLYRRSISPESVRLKVEALRFEFAELSYTGTRSHLKRVIGVDRRYQVYGDTERIADFVGGIKWLEAEVSIPIGSFLVLALPSDDRSIFCALKVTRANEKNMEVGFLSEKILSLAIGGTDPVCGKSVMKGNERKDASELKASLVYKGDSYFFCSEECRVKFEGDPDRYLKKAKFQRKVVSLSPGIIAPRPKLAIVPELSPVADSGHQTEYGQAQFDLDEQGRIVSALAMRSDSTPLNHAVGEALDQWMFDPKTENGKPAASKYAANISVSADAEETLVANRPGLDLKRPDLLSKAEEYCRKLENAALYFVCRERIVETIYPNDELMIIKIVLYDRIKGEQHGYMGSKNVPSGESVFAYDYQLIRKGGRIRENRILIEEKEKNPTGSQVYPKTRRFFIDRTILGPVGLFGRDAQSRFQYQVIKETHLDGKPVGIVEVKPKGGSPGESGFGKAWLDEATGAVLKMEIDVKSFSGYERIWAEYTSQGFMPSVSFEIAYSYENGGVFYPSRIRLKESKYGVRISELTIDYDRYKVFSVGTEVKIK